MRNWTLFLSAMFVLAPAAARCDTPEGRTEITVFAGVSLLDAKTERSRPLPFTSRAIPPFPVPFDITFREERSLGGSAILGFKVGRYVARRAEVELALTAGPSHELRTVSSYFCNPERPCPLVDRAAALFAPTLRDRSKVPAYHYDLNLTYDLATGEVRPFLSFGVGGVTYDIPDGAETRFAFNVVAGAKLYFGERIGARLEIGDHVVPDHFLTKRVEHDVQVRGGLVFRP
jgi:hypothetical protein